ncbi:MAG: hypothetical protein J2P17_36395, partial [Mycobacterium sp.]|nr:hypothetical protein [Mycobacterium sp.]
MPVILVDTFEDVTSNPDRYLEQLVQRVMWLLPNVLFVVTGRNRLTWDDARLAGQLDWAGARCWPSLRAHADIEPTQHLIGYLSATDCEEYLAHRLTKDESPLISADIRDTITARSGGLPLYLDLAVLRFLTVYRDSGTVPTVDEFDADFSALVTRTFRDLGPDERHILRAVSLLDGFSVHLATETAGFLRDSAALRLSERPFVENDPSGIWPHRLHELIRDAIREADSTSSDRWSSRDWRSAAARAHRALGREASRETVSSAKFVACLSQSLRLARDFDLDLDWLTPATFRYVEDAIWQPINVSAGESHNSASALIDTLAIVTARNHRHRARTANELRAILAAGLLPDELTELPEYYLAMCHRDLGRFDDSIAGMRRVARRGGHLAGEATRGLLHLSRRLGNFTEALELTEHLGPEDKRQRALGELWWSHGQIVLACTSLDRARQDAIARGWSGEAALCQAYLAFVSAFADRPSALEHIDHATH